MWFRLELISQWIKIVPSVPEAPPMFRLELISQWIKIGDSEAETLIMADEFRAEYLKTHMVYANQFQLDAGSADFYELFDADMEFPAA